MMKRSANGAMTLPGEYYTSEEIYRQELESIFYQRWIYAGRLEQLAEPGSYFLYQIGRESIIVTNDAGGQVHAFYNVCRHRGTRLCTEINGTFPGKIQCPYHAWTFTLDGRLIGAPNMKDVANFDLTKYPLHRAASAVWNGFIFLNLFDRPEPFQQGISSHAYTPGPYADLESLLAAFDQEYLRSMEDMTLAEVR